MNDPEHMSIEDPTLGEVIRRMANMEKKLDLVYERQLSAPQCPSPGSCLMLAESQKILAGRVTHLEDKEIDTLKKDVSGLKLWQGRITAGIAIFIFLLTLFGPAIRRAFNME